ncbi:MAG: hypothetical protein H7333_07635, partial [Bdellovibrionales bacterium]|nr:hypothetical protein [Oligoflexia bacterium]
MFDFTKTAFRLSTLSFLLTLTACEQQFKVKEILGSLSLPSTGTSAVPGVTPSTPAPQSTPNSDICFVNPTAPACIKTPVVTTPGVVTILFTMSQIPQGSATLILVNAIKYASPSHSPKILFLKDSA